MSDKTMLEALGEVELLAQNNPMKWINAALQFVTDHTAEIRHNTLRLKALERAMDEHGPEGYVSEVLERASELLREWGFDSGEVE